jgi:hypothetical protein
MYTDVHSAWCEAEFIIGNLDMQLNWDITQPIERASKECLWI